jgi:hypothetical protein
VRCWWFNWHCTQHLLVGERSDVNRDGKINLLILVWIYALEQFGFNYYMICSDDTIFLSYWPSLYGYCIGHGRLVTLLALAATTRNCTLPIKNQFVMVSTHLSLRLVGLFSTPAILVLHIENQAPRLFLKVWIIFYLSEAYVFLKHAVHGVSMGNTSSSGVSLLLSSGMS